MLKIAPIPDAAYEICTIFAPDCRNHSRHRLTNLRNYSPMIHSTSPTYYEGASQSIRSSSYAGEAFSTTRSYYETNYNNLNSSQNYGRTSSTISKLNVSYNEENENLKETDDENDENESEEENTWIEDNEDYNYNRLVNATYATRSTTDTYLRNQSAVS